MQTTRLEMLVMVAAQFQGVMLKFKRLTIDDTSTKTQLNRLLNYLLGYDYETTERKSERCRTLTLDYKVT